MTVKHFEMEFDPLQETLDGVGDMAPAAAAERLARTATRLASTVGSPLRRMRIQQGETVVELEWPDGNLTDAGAVAAPAGAAAAAVSSRSGEADAAPADEADERRHHHVTAPMVGSFYHAPEPGAAPFVQVGDVVEQGQHIGIVEAMKLMNPIQAEQPGRVVAMLVDNGQPVEYDQPLIALEPLDSADLEGADAPA